MSLYKVGLTSAGYIVVGSEWPVTKYEELARKLWADTTTPYAIVSITRGGETFMVSPYSDKSDASDHYGIVTDSPGKAAYVAYFDRNVRPGENPLIDSAFFIAIPEAPAPVKVSPTPKKTGNLALAFGLGAAGLAGLIAFKPKRRAL